MKRLNVKLAVVGVTCSLVALVSLAACAPQSASTATPSNDTPTEAVAFTWSYDADCGMCHATEQSSMDDTTCLAATHKAEGNTCATCHADEQGLTSAHEGATPELAEKRATKLRSTKIDEAACLSCHGSYEELAKTTASSAVLTDSEGTTVNPHALPENEDHAETDCSSCHAMHSDEPAEESAPDYCESCHHAGVYSCHTCHD